MKNIIDWNKGAVFQDNQQYFGNNTIWNYYNGSLATEEKVNFTLFIDQQRSIDSSIDRQRNLILFIDQKRDFGLEL